MEKPIKGGYNQGFVDQPWRRSMPLSGFSRLIGNTDRFGRSGPMALGPHHQMDRFRNLLLGTFSEDGRLPWEPAATPEADTPELRSVKPQRFGEIT
jgi:hypothetical protein